MKTECHEVNRFEVCPGRCTLIPSRRLCKALKVGDQFFASFQYEVNIVVGSDITGQRNDTKAVVSVSPKCLEACISIF
jgi:hypothetical protein